MTTKRKLLVVTDLDGSLLDDNYSWNAALPALKRLRQLKIPLVLNSSKTVSEMRDMVEALGIQSPVVAENGGLLAVHEDSGFFEKGRVLTRAGDYLIETTGLSRDFILSKAHALRATEDYQFAGFSDWSIEQVREYTGLSPVGARRSKSRHATEPILWQDTPERFAAFEDALAKDGIRILEGGRFLHLMGQEDKADGMKSAVALYQKQMPSVEWVVVALGDSQNDCAMLEAADIAVVIPHADGPHITPNAPRVVNASAPSTVGWNDALLTIIQEEGIA
ncbi:MAG: HAD-IIB family hydrolase [Opitutaceae bacterium]